MPAHAGHTPVAVVLAIVVLAGYELGAWRLRRRGDRWPPVRDVVFGAGAATAAGAVLLPPGTFTGHMLQHVLLGMLAPVLLVLARPVTLLLRAVPPAARRGLKPVLGSRAAAVLVFPPFAALLEAGSLWLLYRTGLFAAIGHEPLLHVHVFATGVLFTASVCRLDPLRHSRGLGVRAGALVGAAAAHAVLAKTLYAAAPPGVVLAVADRQAGAELMYYGGDAVELAIAVILAVQWYAARGRAETRGRRRGRSRRTGLDHGVRC